MSFIGILTEQKQEMDLKKQLDKNKMNNILFLNEKTIDNMKNITFETVLLGRKIEEEQKEVIRAMIQKAKYLILNSDIKENLDLLENLQLILISYGYNQKATITISSMEENEALLCLQRNIQNKYGEEIESQEIEMPLANIENPYAVMEYTSLRLLYEQQENSETTRD